MKNQYLGDVGDYGKYGLLRYLANNDIRIGVNWYLTADDGSNDGKFVSYLNKDEDRRYENGSYSAANLLNVYSCLTGDYIAVYSTDKNGDKYAKVHALSAVAEHTLLQLKGNQVVPTDSTEVSYVLIKAHQYHFVSALSLKDYQTTTSSGFRRKNVQLRATFDNLEKLAKQ